MSAEDRALKFPSAARVALTTHAEPTAPGVNVDPLRVHTPDTLSHVNAPVPDPPDTDNANGSPKTASVVVTVSDDCDARETVMLKEDDVTGS